jgi:hypothetical protein
MGPVRVAVTGAEIAGSSDRTDTGKLREIKETLSSIRRNMVEISTAVCVISVSPAGGEALFAAPVAEISGSSDRTDRGRL